MTITATCRKTQLTMHINPIHHKILKSSRKAYQRKLAIRYFSEMPFRQHR